VYLLGSEEVRSSASNHQAEEHAPAKQGQSSTSSNPLEPKALPTIITTP
jgi:hypothetical protein